jgi:hypothetical protein
VLTTDIAVPRIWSDDTRYTGKSITLVSTIFLSFACPTLVSSAFPVLTHPPVHYQVVVGGFGWAQVSLRMIPLEGMVMDERMYGFG